MSKIKLIDLLYEESSAAKQAKAKGLKSKGFGNWADSSGKVVAQTKNGQLVPTKEPKEPAEKKAKEKKKKSATDADSKKDSGSKKVDKNKEKPKKEPKQKDDSQYDKKDAKDGEAPKPSKNNPKGVSDQGSTVVDASGEVPEYESQRKHSKEQHKKEAGAKGRTTHDRGNGHFAGKNKQGNVQGFFGKDAEIKADLYAKGKEVSDDEVKAERKRRDDRAIKLTGLSGSEQGGEWSDMLDAGGVSKSWWEDLLTSFEKEAGDIKSD